MNATYTSAAGVARAWLGGNFALGNKVSETEKLRLIVATADGKHLVSDERFLLKQRLMGLYARGVDLSEHFESNDPEDCIELKLDGKGGKQ